MWRAGWGRPLLGGDVWMEAWMNRGLRSEPWAYWETHFPGGVREDPPTGSLPAEVWQLCQFWNLLTTCHVPGTLHTFPHFTWWAPPLGPCCTWRNWASKKSKHLALRFTRGKWQTWDSNPGPRAWVVPQGRALPAGGGVGWGIPQVGHPGQGCGRKWQGRTQWSFKIVGWIPKPFGYLFSFPRCLSFPFFFKSLPFLLNPPIGTCEGVYVGSGLDELILVGWYSRFLRNCPSK